MEKSELRKIYRKKRSAISVYEHSVLSQKIAATLFTHIDLGKVRALHCFVPIEKLAEIDTMIIFERVWREFPDIRTAVPKLRDREGALEHFYFTRDTRMVANAWGISEPVGGPGADPKDLDLVLVPLLCFDESGHRVGYGGGYYDGFLRECRPDCITAGLSFFPPVKEIEGIHDGDVRLEMFVMPDGIFKPAG